MKKKIILYILCAFSFSCTLDENVGTPYLSKEEAFSNPQSIGATVRGVYANVLSYKYFSNAYMRVTTRNSGFFVTNHTGNSKDNQNNTTICSLKPLSANEDINSLWEGSYTTIANANNIILNTNPALSDNEVDKEILTDALGHAYFLRGFTYFNLVRFWGDIPVRIEEVTLENIHVKKTRAKEVYDIIISDAQNAIDKMTDVSNENGVPHRYAANMLLAKVYMTLATADPELQTLSSAEYWQLAYDNALEVYKSGQYQLEVDYQNLWSLRGNYSKESIFELDYVGGNQENSMSIFREWTVHGFTNSQGWTAARVSPEIYDRHIAAYGKSDLRVAENYITHYTKTLFHGGEEVFYYPDVFEQEDVERTRLDTDNWMEAFPLFFKSTIKDRTANTFFTERNWPVFRFGDLLLMLAECANELGKAGEKTLFVQKVLDRAGVVNPIYSQGSQDEFRNAIMNEYTYELLGEGHTWFNNRRRGYEFFKSNVIDPHNNYEKRNEAIDITLDANKETVMLLPIPLNELNTNNLINEYN